MVIKGLKRITNFGNPKEKIFTQFGIITRQEFNERESRRFPQSLVLKDNTGRCALFIKGEE